ncbi:hypothetical protein Tco_0961489 [Tanacetum coccineum]
MVACLKKTEGNSDFHEIVDFLASSSIHHALTIRPPIYTSYIEQFWNTARSQTVNDVKQINATVDSKAVVVTEASIRSSLLFNDADGTACLTNEAIFQNLALMGYEGDFNKLTFQKALFSPQWKYLIHTILHCLSSKSTSWNEFSTNIASAVICLETNQKFNFSKLIFDGMLRNLDNTKKKFLMYPRFLMVFLNNQIELGEPFNDVYPTPAHNLKVFTNMSRKGLKFLGKITPLFPNMLTHAAEGEGSGEPTEPQPTPSPTQPSTGDQPPETSSSHATTQDSRDSLEGTNGNEGDQVQIPHDSPLSGGHTSDRAEGALNLQELSVLCTNLSNRVLAMESRPLMKVVVVVCLPRPWMPNGDIGGGRVRLDVGSGEKRGGGRKIKEIFKERKAMAGFLSRLVTKICRVLTTRKTVDDDEVAPRRNKVRTFKVLDQNLLTTRTMDDEDAPGLKAVPNFQVPDEVEPEDVIDPAEMNTLESRLGSLIQHDTITRVPAFKGYSGVFQKKK